MTAHATALQPEPETVDTLLGATVRIIEDERSRGATADTKAGQLVGFTGVILAIDTALGRDVFDHGISGAYSDVFVAFFVVSLVILVVAAFVAIRGALLPQTTLAFRRRDVEGLADGDLVLADSVEIKRALIRTYGQELVTEEQRNDRKLEVLQRAGLLLMTGVLALACEGATLAVDQLAMNSKVQQNSQPSGSTALGDAERPKPPTSLPLGLVKKGGPEPPEGRNQR
jgi:hypothetical protein